MENKQNRYLTKPTNKYLVYESKKVAFRKTQGNEEKIITTFKKYVENLHNALVEDLEQGNIHENHITLLTQKIGKSSINKIYERLVNKGDFRYEN